MLAKPLDGGEEGLLAARCDQRRIRNLLAKGREGSPT